MYEVASRGGSMSIAGFRLGLAFAFKPEALILAHFINIVVPY
jgi:hypothetical protein